MKFALLLFTLLSGSAYAACNVIDAGDGSIVDTVRPNGDVMSVHTGRRVGWLEGNDIMDSEGNETHDTIRATDSRVEIHASNGALLGYVDANGVYNTSGVRLGFGSGDCTMNQVAAGWSILRFHGD